MGLVRNADLNTLITKLQKIGYYQELFKYTYGSETVSENSTCTIYKSIQSFDSKYDAGRALKLMMTNPSILAQKIKENLFLTAPILTQQETELLEAVQLVMQHQNLILILKNNGIGVLNGTGIDIQLQEHPLYEILLKLMVANGPFMHTLISFKMLLDTTEPLIGCRKY
jgi:cytochrome c peroxidase